MADHVAVLRRLRCGWANGLLTESEAEAIDHAIAACEREAEREAEVERLKSVPAVALAAATAKVLADTQAKHAALADSHANLLARLGEADALLAEVSRSGWGRNTMFDIAKKTPPLERIDDYLARAVKENESERNTNPPL